MAQMKAIRVDEFGEPGVMRLVDVERPSPAQGEVLAEFATVWARNLIPVPDGMGFDEAAAVPLQGLTAYHVLETSGQLREGESVLVHAAAGGVGSLAIQMAKLMGASPVIATASTKEKLDLAARLGADVLVNYAEEDWPEKVREVTEGD